jgi:hypothetical protein
MVQHATTSATLSRSRARPRRHASSAPPYAAVRARWSGRTTDVPCAVPRLALSQDVRAPRRLEHRATHRAFLSTSPTPYYPCFARSDASPLHARRQGESPYWGATPGAYYDAPLRGRPAIKAACCSCASRRAAAGAIEGSRGEPRVPAGCTPNRDSLHLPLHLL